LSGDLTTQTLDTFLPRNHLGLVLSRVKHWMRTGSEWLTLSGPPGTGKTHLLAGIANLAIDTKTPALYTTVADLIGDLQRTFDPKSDQVFSSLFARVLDVPVLLLDELEKWRGTQWASEQMFRMFEHRMRHGKTHRTVLATNMDLRPMLAGRKVTVLTDPLYPDYLESRIAGGTLLTEFWLEHDFRPIAAAARREEARAEAKANAPKAAQEGLL